mmetsp:Transcript_7178/g.14951  ORF Transcript_7178/g.14951 Transcript_7178/m.14951 type:complete len:89 (-) Transcript_7178:217-483(-)
MMVNALEARVAAVGYDKLGIKRGEIGTHSIRSGAAMAVYLDGCPMYTINDREVVERCFPPLHQEASQTIQPQFLPADAALPIPPSYPR